MPGAVATISFYCGTVLEQSQQHIMMDKIVTLGDGMNLSTPIVVVI
jgi:hypothetical protein